MDALWGRSVPALKNLCFGYGSNLLEREVKCDAQQAEPVGMAFLPLCVAKTCSKLLAR